MSLAAWRPWWLAPLEPCCWSERMVSERRQHSPGPVFTILHCAGTLALDGTLMSWVLTVLIMLFMFSSGLAIVSFPWMFMGKLFIVS